RDGQGPRPLAPRRRASALEGRAPGLRARELRARPEGGDGGRPGFVRCVSAVEPRGPNGRTPADDAGRLPSSRRLQRLRPSGSHRLRRLKAGPAVDKLGKLLGMKRPMSRITEPLVKENGALRPASWDEALDRAAAGFKRSIERHGPTTFGMFSCS